MTKKISKQAQAKLDQNYRKKPDSCSNCVNYECAIVKVDHENWRGIVVGSHEEEKNKICTIGNFAVMKSAVCDKHELKKD